MATANKTKATEQSVEAFLQAVEPQQRREDAAAVNDMMKRITGLEPKMWGPTMVGFGTYHYKYESGREGDFFLVGFSPRKAALTLYIRPGFLELQPQLDRLGKYKTGVGCLYINKLADIDMSVLEEIVTEAFSSEAPRAVRPA
jgi:hypothetical protein